MASRKLNQSTTNPGSSIEKTVGNNTSSIELLAVIDDLIDNKMYRNKFRKLIREGHLRGLLELAEQAGSKDKPSHWFAKVTAKRR